MKLSRASTYALIAFLAAWQGTEFSLDYRAFLGALVAGIMGGLNPHHKDPADLIDDYDA